MKVAINEQFGDIDQIKLVEREIPKPSSGEVLVKVHAAGLNPKDILIRKGKFKIFTGKKFPQGIGFDFAGVIEDANNMSYQQGDRVFGMLNGWQGRSCAEYVTVKEKELFQMPENISFEAAAGIPLAGQTALQAMRDIGNLSNHQKILLNGASGGVGTLAIQIAKVLGGEVTTISSTKNIDFCQTLGADVALSYEKLKLVELKDKYEVFFDVFGNYTFQKIAPILSKNGRYVTTVPKPPIFKEQLFNFFRSKKAKLVYVKSKKEDIKWLGEKIAEANIKPVIDKVFEFEEIAAAQKYIESKRAKGKVILRMDS